MLSKERITPRQQKSTSAETESLILCRQDTGDSERVDFDQSKIWLNSRGYGNTTQQSSSSLDDCRRKETLRIVRSGFAMIKSVTRDIKVSILNSIKAWIDIYALYGFSFRLHSAQKLARPILKTLNDIVDVLVLNPQCTWVDYFKYKNAAFFSHYMKQEMPPQKFRSVLQHDGCLFGGVFYKWTKRTCGQATNFRIEKEVDVSTWREETLGFSFCQSILYSKKGQPRPTKEMVRAAEIKSVVTMTTVKPEVSMQYMPSLPSVADPDDEDFWGPTYEVSTNYYGTNKKILKEIKQELEPITIDRKFLTNELARTVREVFGRKNKSGEWDNPFNLDELVKAYLPSTSSNYNNTCSKFGTFGFFDEKCRPKISFPDINLDTVSLQRPVPEAYGLEGILEGIAIEQLDENSERTTLGARIDIPRFDVEYKDFYWSRFKAALDEKPYVKVVGLAEPLKVRCITKGPPNTYFALKPMQKFMWKTMKKQSTFRLIGEPITEQVMNQEFGRLTPGTRFHSGDYSAATDELYSWASEACLDELIVVLEEQVGFSLQHLKELMLRALTGHEYEVQEEYVDDKGKIKKQRNYKKQKRGQLMGSIISFPFLCLINAALMRTSFEQAHLLKISLKNLPVVVNGDDCLTAYTSPGFPKIWEHNGTVMGLTKSVGKTYDSDSFCCINSQFFLLKRGLWKVVPFINLGLLYGLKRSSIGDSLSADVTELGGLCDKLKEQSRGLDQGKIMRAFIHKNGNTLRTFEGSWSLPIWATGLGLFNETPSKFDLKRVTALKQMYNRGERVPKKRTDVEWCLHNRIMDEIKDKTSGLVVEYNYEGYKGDEDYGNKYIALAYAIWSRDGMSALTAPEGKSKSELLHMTKLWHKAGRVVKENPNIRETKIEYIEKEQRNTVVPIY
jgi:hypothetical protein